MAHDPIGPALARRLQATSALPVQLVETHISWLLLADTMAWKLKKPVALPFLDFTRVEDRRHFCEEELRLGRRLARGLYLGIDRVTGTPDAPALGGDGPAIDYALRMRRFAPGSLLADHARAGTLAAHDVDRLAATLAAFHLAAPRAAPDTPFGLPAARGAVPLASLDGLAALRPDPSLAPLRAWLQAQAAALAPRWAARREQGWVREGHGDLHLANLLLLDDEPTAFDPIEFDPALRWIDIADDAAFTVMDLLAHGLAALAWRFLDGWLEATGDHAGLPLWRHALVARALVRAHVGAIREAQGGAPGVPAAADYRALAQRLAGEPPAPALTITHGLPGSGKSVAALALVQRRGAIRLRSDVERKRLAGLAPRADSHAAGLDLYTRDATLRTYDRLAALASEALRAGWPVVVDAAFLRRDERSRFAALARAEGVPFAILACEAPMPELRARLERRRRHGGDPSEADDAVLERLAAAAEPLTADERASAVAPDPSVG